MGKSFRFIRSRTNSKGHFQNVWKLQWRGISNPPLLPVGELDHGYRIPGLAEACAKPVKQGRWDPAWPQSFHDSLDSSNICYILLSSVLSHSISPSKYENHYKESDETFPCFPWWPAALSRTVACWSPTSMTSPVAMVRPYIQKGYCKTGENQNEWRKKWRSTDFCCSCLKKGKRERIYIINATVWDQITLTMSGIVLVASFHQINSNNTPGGYDSTEILQALRHSMCWKAGVQIYIKIASQSSPKWEFAIVTLMFLTQDGNQSYLLSVSPFP